jgi:hypothetical protein
MLPAAVLMRPGKAGVKMEGLFERRMLLRPCCASIMLRICFKDDACNCC